MKRSTREWIQKADGDLKVARRELQASDPVYDAICFHAQQCVEKYLKALCEERRGTVPKTHDLIVLLNELGASVGQLEPERKALARLGAYAVAFRYPGEDAGIQEAQEAVSIAEQVRSVLRENVGLPNEP